MLACAGLATVQLLRDPSRRLVIAIVALTTDQSEVWAVADPQNEEVISIQFAS